MSAEKIPGDGSYEAADRRAGPTEEYQDHNPDASAPLEAVPSSLAANMPSGSSMPSGELPRKRKGDVEGRSDSSVQQSLDYEMEEDFRSEGEDQHAKMKCFREPHRQIEKRRRDKMNNLIDELSAMIPACNPVARKLDKLTVLRKAVQQLKALKVGTTTAFADTAYKPSFLPQEDLKDLVLRAADGFLLVVSCDRGKILFISESVSKILNFSRIDLTGQSLFHFIHPKDIGKVKEQLSASELFPRERLVDATTGVQVQAERPVALSHLSTGARRSFFCRMKHSRGAPHSGASVEDRTSLSAMSKKKDSHRYCTIHCTGYMHSWLSSQLEAESDTEKESSHLSCLVTVCRVHQRVPPQPPQEVSVKPTKFVTRCAIDGKFTFIDQQATTVIGYLPQEVLGTSCYEFFHQDDLHHLAENHRQVLRSKDKIETNCYKFKTKYGPYVSLQSQWFSFTNPWTKEVEFIVSVNRVILGHGHTKEDEEPGSSKDDSKRILPIIPGLSSGAGKMIYAGSIGTQIANELIESYRMSSSPSSGAASPFGPVNDKSPLISPHTSRSVSSVQEAAGTLESQSDLRSEALACINTPGDTGEESQLDLDNMVPGLSSFSSDEAAMAVIMSLLETDINMGQSVDFEDIHWPL